MNQDYETALESLAEARKAERGTRNEDHSLPRSIPTSEGWTADRLRKAVDEYYASHRYICLDPNARNVRHTYVVPAEDKKTWRVQQVLVDPDEHNDWMIEFEVDLGASKTTGEPVLQLRRVGAIGG